MGEQDLVPSWDSEFSLCQPVLHAYTHIYIYPMDP